MISERLVDDFSQNKPNNFKERQIYIKAAAKEEEPKEIL
jgi:hypothetical protein